jgi:hypothetical protein
LVIAALTVNVLDSTTRAVYCRLTTFVVRSNFPAKVTGLAAAGRRRLAMNNPRTRFSLVLFGVVVAAASVLGQQSKPAPSATPAPRHIACWKQVGISPAVMQQRRALMEAAKGKVQAVCTDTSLTPQQKKEQIRQIHQEAAQQSEGLIPAAQMEALKKCQATYGSGTHPARTTSPCGEPLESEDAPPPDQN